MEATNDLGFCKVQDFAVMALAHLREYINTLAC